MRKKFADVFEEYQKKAAIEDDVADTIAALIERYKEAVCPQEKLCCVLQIIEIAIGNY